MSLKHEYTGKSVDDAINNACEQLSLGREELDIEVVSPGSAGIFGLCRKKAKVRVARKQNLEADTPAVSEKPPVKPVAEAAPKGKAEHVRGGKERAPSAPRRPATVQVQEEAPQEVVDAAREELATILRLMGFSASVAVANGDSGLQAEITGEDSDRIVGEDGQLLDSIQYLLRKILSKKFQKKIMVTVDAGAYRAQRRQQLEELAVQLAAEVKETGKSKTVQAMNPAERRIVHMAIQDDTAIRSRSVGEGIYKKILIYLPGKNGRKPGRRRGRGGRSRSSNT